MLEIVMKTSEMYVLKESKLFDEKNIIGFCALLSMGDINDIFNQTSKTISYCKINPKEEIQQLKNKLKEYKEIRIWYSSIDNEQLCNLYFIIDLLKDNDIIIHTIDVGKEKIWSISCFHESEVQKLLKYNLTLSKEDIQITNKHM